MNWRSLLLILTCVLCIGACSKMYFPKPLPSRGESVMDLPDFLKGKFLKKEPKVDGGGMEFLEIKRINKQHCKIYTYYAFSKDSIYHLIKEMNTDSSSAELQGNTLIYTTKDSIEKTVFKIEGELFFTPKDTLCEIDLSAASFRNDFPEGEGKKLVLKKAKGVYYLNVLEKNVGDSGKDYWFVVRFGFNNPELTITNTSIKDSTFAQKLDDYHKIAPIEKLGSNQYLCQANDEQFFKLFEKPGLFEKVVWQVVPDERKQVLLYLAGLGLLGLVVLSLVIWVVRYSKRH